MDARAILHFQIRREITSLYKRFLNTLEDMRQEHQTFLKKLEANLPPEYHGLLKNSNYFDDDKFTYMRKRVLDTGNESSRGVEEHIKQFDVSFGGQ